jgi:hypothetical protein
MKTWTQFIFVSLGAQTIIQVESYHHPDEAHSPKQRSRSGLRKVTSGSHYVWYANDIGQGIREGHRRKMIKFKTEMSHFLQICTPKR